MTEYMIVSQGNLLRMKMGIIRYDGQLAYEVIIEAMNGKKMTEFIESSSYQNVFNKGLNAMGEATIHITNELRSAFRQAKAKVLQPSRRINSLH